jgi:plastocyanin
VRRFAIAPLVVAALALAACGGSSSKSSSATTAGSSAAAVSATLSEWKIAVGGTVKAGTVTFDVQNAGTFAHNLTVAGPGVSGKTTGNLDAGKSGTLTLDLKPGAYELYCSIPGHKAQGMDLKLTVS